MQKDTLVQKIKFVVFAKSLNNFFIKGNGRWGKKYNDVLKYLIFHR